MVDMTFQSTPITPEDGKTLLQAARTAIARHLQQKRDPLFDEERFKKSLWEKRGVFVTLTQEGRLRGCVGYLEPSQPLIRAVAQVAVEAAFHDPRFLPLKEEEWPAVSLEISVLSPMVQVTDFSAIQVGRDGLLVRKGVASGLLLPQVASEYRWTREEFLTQTCLKAGLSTGAWKEKKTRVYSFTAEIFSEKTAHV